MLPGDVSTTRTNRFVYKAIRVVFNGVGLSVVGFMVWIMDSGWSLVRSHPLAVLVARVRWHRRRHPARQQHCDLGGHGAAAGV